MWKEIPRLRGGLVFPIIRVKTINITLIVLDCNTLHVAILQRRESQVEDIIRIDPSAIHFRNALGQSALHVAADWPWATALLLASGADPYQVDTRGFTAVDYACDLEIYEVVRILLEAGSPLLEDNTLQGVMASCARDNSRELFKLIVFHLAIRRRELLQIAKTLFTENVLDTIVPLQEAVPDSSSYLLTEAVCTEICTVKPEYWSQSLRGLYQSRKMNPAAADVLYEAGFTYLEGRDPLGITPLTTTLTSAMTVWLYQKGASFTAWYTPPTKPKLLPPGPSMYTAIVRVVSSLLIHNTGDRRSVRFDRKEDIKALSIFLQDEFSECRDLCRCPCCSEGCSPQDMVLKSLWVSLKQGVSKYYTPALHRLARFVQQVDEILIELYGRLGQSSYTRLCQAAIRITLSMDLGIRHLCCCRFDFWGITHAVCQEEAEEIREEDSFLLQRFEALLPKALSEWGGSLKISQASGVTSIERTFAANEINPWTN